MHFYIRRKLYSFIFLSLQSRLLIHNSLKLPIPRKIGRKDTVSISIISVQLFACLYRFTRSYTLYQSPSRMFDLIVVGIILSEMVINLKYFEKYTTKFNVRGNKNLSISKSCSHIVLWIPLVLTMEETSQVDHIVAEYRLLIL